jgi:hypothetical protein
MQKNQSHVSPSLMPEVSDIKTNTKGLITLLILAGLGIAGFLAFVTYYAILWTPGKPLEMMQ